MAPAALNKKKKKGSKSQKPPPNKKANKDIFTEKHPNKDDILDDSGSSSEEVDEHGSASCSDILFDGDDTFTDDFLQENDDEEKVSGSDSSMDSGSDSDESDIGKIQELLMNEKQRKKKMLKKKCDSTLQKNLMNSDCPPRRNLKKKHTGLQIFQTQRVFAYHAFYFLAGFYALIVCKLLVDRNCLGNGRSMHNIIFDDKKMSNAYTNVVVMNKIIYFTRISFCKCLKKNFS